MVFALESLLRGFKGQSSPHQQNPYRAGHYCMAFPFLEFFTQIRSVKLWSVLSIEVSTASEPAMPRLDTGNSSTTSSLWEAPH